MDLYDNHDLKPMLLDELDVPFNDKDYLFEIKFDGTRALLFVDSQNIFISNRRGNDITKVFPELDSIKKIVNDKVIFDGEIVVMVDGRASFKHLQERALLKSNFKINYFKDSFPVTFICYDILYEGKNLINMPLFKRKEILNKYPDTDYFMKTLFIEKEGVKLYKLVQKEGLEGIVAKEKDSLYLPGKRTSKWIKIKNWKEEIFFVCGYQINEKAAMASLILGRTEFDEFYYVGSVTIGKKNPDFTTILKSKVIKKSPLKDFDEIDTVYIKPNIQCNIGFLEKTSNDKLRQPIYKGLK